MTDPARTIAMAGRGRFGTPAIDGNRSTSSVVGVPGRACSRATRTTARARSSPLAIPYDARTSPLGDLPVIAGRKRDDRVSRAGRLARPSIRRSVMTLRRAVAFASVMALVSVIGGRWRYAWSSGVRFYAVDSGSMSPTFNTGDLVVDMPVTPTTVYHVGDVVTFHPTPGYTATHRIAAIGPDGITTKGDANPSSDVGPIQPGMIAGPRRVLRALRRVRGRLLPKPARGGRAAAPAHRVGGRLGADGEQTGPAAARSDPRRGLAVNYRRVAVVWMCAFAVFAALQTRPRRHPHDGLLHRLPRRLHSLARSGPRPTRPARSSRLRPTRPSRRPGLGARS